MTAGYHQQKFGCLQQIFAGDSQLKYMDNIGWYIDKNIKLIKLFTDFFLFIPLRMNIYMVLHIIHEFHHLQISVLVILDY